MLIQLSPKSQGSLSVLGCDHSLCWHHKLNWESGWRSGWRGLRVTRQPPPLLRGNYRDRVLFQSFKNASFVFIYIVYITVFDGVCAGFSVSCHYGSQDHVSCENKLNSAAHIVSQMNSESADHKEQGLSIMAPEQGLVCDF